MTKSAFLLSQIPGSEYIPRAEFSSPDRGKGEGIWDVLGEYDARLDIIILYENEITSYAKTLSFTDGLAIGSEEAVPDVRQPILRELVRLHEHAHAYLHTARVLQGELRKERQKRYYEDRDWFTRLPMEINESLTQFIVASLLRSGPSAPLFLKAFDEVNIGLPQYYKKWELPLGVSANTWFVPPLVKFARTKIWRNWDEFCHQVKLKRTWRTIKTEAVLLKLAAVGTITVRCVL
jgi:hypothetical protein